MRSRLLSQELRENKYMNNLQESIEYLQNEGYSNEEINDYIYGLIDAYED